MKLEKLPNPRPQQTVQCCHCFKMIKADKAIIDLDGVPYKSYYHEKCADTLPVFREWKYITTKLDYYFWKYETDTEVIYNVTKTPKPPRNEAGYRSYAYLLKVKGLLKGDTVWSLLAGLNQDESEI